MKKLICKSYGDPRLKRYERKHGWVVECWVEEEKEDATSQ